jgi:hypothetical protein
VLVVLVCSGYFTASRVERTRNLKLEESYFGVKCLNFRKTGCCSNGLLNMQGLYTKNTGKIQGLYTENTGKAIGIIPVSKSSFTRDEKCDCVREQKSVDIILENAEKCVG